MNRSKVNSGASCTPWAWVRKVREMIDNGDCKEQSLPAQVLPWLYISDELSALDKHKLQSLGITHVLSLNGVTPNQASHISEKYQVWGLCHKRISAEDSEEYDLIGKHWEECHEFLKSVKQTEGSKVVVHCVAGINRSGLIVCAAHLIMEKTPLLEVVKKCTEAKQGPLLWNKSFQEQLCVLAAANDLLGDKPEGFSDEPLKKEKIAPPPKSALDRLLR
mmetsp:Transcript_9701/g.14598  ORF Transcript_9701/g.14598 Transcript_9701/m.14598 type:complete len:219 (+) Transcript_9701:59-715(+)